MQEIRALMKIGAEKEDPREASFQPRWAEVTAPLLKTPPDSCLNI